MTERGSCVWWVVVSLAVSGCPAEDLAVEEAPVEEAPVEEPTPAGVRGQLEYVHARLEEALMARSEEAAKELPVWLGQPADEWSLQQVQMPEDVEELRAVVGDPDVPAWMRAYAMLWLTSQPDMERDLELVAGLLGEDEAIGLLPTYRHRQAANAPPEFSWQRYRLENVATVCCGRLVGVNFEDAEEYALWAAQNPVLRESHDYWSWRLERTWTHGLGPEQGTREENLAAVLAELMEDRELCVRVLLLGDRNSTRFAGGRDLVSHEELVELVRVEVGPDRMLQMLETGQGWPEFDDPQSGKEWRWRYAQWTTEHAVELFEPRHGAALVRIWEAAVAEGAGVRPAALAAARIAPESESKRVLRASVDAATHPIDRGMYLGEWVALHHPDDWSFVRDQVWDSWGDHPRSHPNEGAAVLRALGDRGPAGADALAELIADPRFDSAGSQEMRAAIEAIHANDPSLEFPLQGGLKILYAKSVRFLAEDDPERVEAQQTFDEAHADCLSRARTWVEGRSAPGP